MLIHRPWSSALWRVCRLRVTDLELLVWTMTETNQRGRMRGALILEGTPKSEASMCTLIGSPSLMELLAVCPRGGS
jgi:hypothetical protein